MVIRELGVVFCKLMVEIDSIDLFDDVIVYPSLSEFIYVVVIGFDLFVVVGVEIEDEGLSVVDELLCLVFDLFDVEEFVVSGGVVVEDEALFFVSGDSGSGGVGRDGIGGGGPGDFGGFDGHVGGGDDIL